MNVSSDHAGQDLGRLARAVNRLAVLLLEQLRRTESGNLFFSPLNILQTLALALAGARGETERQMLNVFGPGLGREELVAAAQRMGEALAADERNKGYDLATAFAAWVKTGARVRDDYARIIRENFGSGIAEHDFARDPAGAAGKINAWAAEQTRGFIKEVVRPEDFNELTLVILTGAIYFLGKWMDEFDPSLTQPEEFLQPGKPPLMAATMWRTGFWRYAETKSYRAVELPYRGGRLAMVVVVPRSKTISAAAAQDLGPGEDQAVSRLLAQLAYAGKEVTVGLPRFELTTAVSLREALEGLGISDAFDPDLADFSGMLDETYFAISKVLHKARVKVDEQGTEAAAVTVLDEFVGAAEDEEPPIYLHVNRPFLFFIIERQTGAVLFLGSVVEPEGWTGEVGGPRTGEGSEEMEI